MTDTFPRLKFQRTAFDYVDTRPSQAASLVQDAIKMLSGGMYQSSYETRIIAKLEQAKAALAADAALPTLYIVKGKVTSPDAYEGQAKLGDTEWQVSDAPEGERGASADYLSLEDVLKYNAPAVFHFQRDDESNWKDKYDITKLADECYPKVWFGPGDDLEVSHEQATSLFRKWKQDAQGMTWLEFAKTVQPTFGMDGAVTVQWCGMYLAVERDGYTHS